MGTYIEFTRSVINGFVGNAGAALGSLPGMDLDATNDIFGVTSANPGTNAAAFPNDPIPGTGQGARGTFIQGIAAAALYGSCIDSAQPANPNNVVPRLPTFSAVPVQPAAPTQGGIPVIP